MILSEILKNVSHEILKGNIQINITSVVYNSKLSTTGSLFVCLKGYNTDGHKYAQNAVDAGAIAVVCEDDIDLIGDVTIIKVENSRQALAYISCAFFDYPAEKLTTIAITGTKGKTSTTNMIKYILEADGIKTGTIGTLGIVIGDETIKTENTTPESYEIQKAMNLMIEKGCKAVVIEASSLGLKWNRICGFDFDYSVFTNFSHDHIGDSEHATMEEYLECKAMLFNISKNGYFNIDDENVKQVATNAKCNVKTFGFSKDADLLALDSYLSSEKGILSVKFQTSGSYNFDGEVAIPGKFNVYNALGAISVCKDIGASDKAIHDGLKNVKVKGRVEPVKVEGNYTLLIDYAHNAISMENVLNTLREYKPNRLITLFGAGGNRPKVRRFEMGEVSGRLSDLSVITEDNSRFEDVMDIIEDIKVGINKTDGKYIVIPNRKDAIKYCIENAEDGDIIVLAGKGHEDYQEIKGIKYHLDEREVIAEIFENFKKQ